MVKPTSVLRPQCRSNWYTLAAWASSCRLVLGQVKVDNKSNEITAIPELLKLLEITGCIITIDAMGTQKAIAASIIDQKADYILALKGNQGNLHKAVKQWFEQARTQQFEGIEHSYYETRESAHDRLEIRQYWTVPADVLGGTFQSEWMGLQSLGMVVSERRLWNKTTYEVRYYISLTSDAKVFAQAVQSLGN